ncbi:hypothetical protein [Gloeocapsopsis dulcis]|uniref:hypothetical protein n=1 Tax=Gloeocapsopsis dulcis TaxID=2859516 RepID=UPI0012DAE8DB|nr:hypothetical protein [Gloeocapsopsis dulcis]WNN87901.1 hypothetical protein P0S91_16490 [Gloeocapsopsis dulcis]
MKLEELEMLIVDALRLKSGLFKLSVPSRTEPVVLHKCVHPGGLCLFSREFMRQA